MAPIDWPAWLRRLAGRPCLDGTPEDAAHAAVVAEMDRRQAAMLAHLAIIEAHAATIWPDRGREEGGAMTVAHNAAGPGELTPLVPS